MNTGRKALAEGHKNLLQLCDRLEMLADGLPNVIRFQDCVLIATSMVNDVLTAQEQEEVFLFPALAASGVHQIITRLRREHARDRSAVIEVSDALLALPENRSVLSPDALGYLLRSFFEGMRRHVDGEKDLLDLLEAGAPPAR